MFFFFNDTATTEIYTLSLHDALPIYLRHELQEYAGARAGVRLPGGAARDAGDLRVPLPLLQEGRLAIGFAARRIRSEEHTSELQSQPNLACRPLLAMRHKWHRRLTRY